MLKNIKIDVFYSGTLELNLNSMPKPVKKSGQCGLDQLPDVSKGHHVKMVSLFEQKRIKGFWPCYNDESGTKELTVRYWTSSLWNFTLNFIVRKNEDTNVDKKCLI